MCGRYKLTPGTDLEELLAFLNAEGEPRYSEDVSPGSTISIIREKDGRRTVEDAKWWLLLMLPDLKPAKLACFNSRYDKLNVPKSLAYLPYRKSRCLIPASAFIETAGDKGSKTAHMIEEPGRLITFGGLYKTWLNRETGELINSASIITLPPVPGWENIHPKSMPMLLDYTNKGLIDKWLDPDFDKVEEFEPLLESKIIRTQRVTPIGKVSQWNAIGDSFEIQGRPA
jgi:putative SOS response-associated peptidase YedK